MSLENILNKIMKDARDEAGRLIAEGKAKAVEIQNKAQQKAEESAELLIEKTIKQAELEASRLITQARLERRIHLLSLKKEIIDDVLKQAFEKGSPAAGILKRKIILKDGEKEEPFDEETLIEELRPKLEKFIAGELKI
jgi:vacuolar-type H+-ATPase subunit H